MTAISPADSSGTKDRSQGRTWPGPKAIAAQRVGTANELVRLSGMKMGGESGAAHENMVLYALEQVRDLIIITARDGTIEYVNRAFELTSGYSRQEVIGKTPRILKSGRHDDTFYKRMWTTILRGRVFHASFVNRRKDGRFFIEDKTIRALVDRDGHIVRFVATGTDITQRTRMRRDLVKQRESQRLFGAHFPGILYRSYLQKRPRTALLSKNAALITGRTLEELAAKSDFPIHPLMPPEDRLRRQKRVAVAVSDNQSFELEYEIRHKDGGSRHFLEYGVPIYDADGRPLHIDGVILDITDRRRLEEKLGMLETALRTLSARLLSLQEMERKRISRDLHDGIGQMLTSIKMRLESTSLLVGEKRIEAATEALEATATMIQQTMDEVRRISTDLRPSILDDLGITATIKWFCRNFAEIHGIRVETDLAIDERAVSEALKTIVYRILQEAMNNVARHANAGLIRVSFQKIDGNVELTIDDNGRGFDVQEVLSAGAFGRGLGLSSMEERVKMSGGSFFLNSVQKVGTVVRAVWALERETDLPPQSAPSQE